MDFRFNETQRLLKETTSQFASEKIPNSVILGERPIRDTIFWYSSKVKPSNFFTKTHFPDVVLYELNNLGKWIYHGNLHVHILHVQMMLSVYIHTCSNM